MAETTQDYRDAFRRCVESTDRAVASHDELLRLINDADRLAFVERQLDLALAEQPHTSRKGSRVMEWIAHDGEGVPMEFSLSTDVEISYYDGLTAHGKVKDFRWTWGAEIQWDDIIWYRRTRPPCGGWAPGSYLCICRTGCGRQFIGDKRAVTCADCAYRDQQEDNSEPYSYHLEQVARTAWHPVSEPPVEEDADEAGLVAVLSPDRLFDLVPYQEVITGVWNDPDDKWARIRDVVLYPPEERGDG